MKNLIKKGRVVLIQLKEGITFTWNELKNNKFRTFLSWSKYRNIYHRGDIHSR